MIWAIYLAAFAFGFCLPFMNMMDGPAFLGWVEHVALGLMAMCLVTIPRHGYQREQ